MRTLFAWILILLAAPMVAVSPFIALDQEGFAAVEADLASLEAGEPPPEQARVRGNLWWPDAIESVTENMRTKEATSNAWYVPFVSDEVLDAWRSAAAAGRAVPLERLAVVVAVAPEMFPAIEDGDVTRDVEIVGAVKPGRAIPLHVKKGFAEHLPALDLDAVVYLQDDSDVAAWEAGLGLFVFSALVLGWGLSLRRRGRGAPSSDDTSTRDALAATAG